MLILAINSGLQAQNIFTDTIKILNYNTNNYGIAPDNNSPEMNTTRKHEYLKTIIKYTNPDIIGLTKMNSSPPTFSTDTVVNKVLNKVCKDCYRAAGYTNVSGNAKVNMLYYKKAKLGYISTTTIYAAADNISDINMYKLYYRSPHLEVTHDTIFIYVVLAHLKSGADNEKKRGKEIAGAMDWLDTHIGKLSNIIFMGDFNTQSSYEKCFQKLVASPNAITRFFDPPNQIGNWAANPNEYAMYLTESARSTKLGDGGSDKKMNFRFDHILCTSPIINGTLKVAYIAGSFKVIGQDGLHTNKAIIDLPKDNAVPPNVLNALYNMSEHLPVEMKLKITITKTH